MVDAVRAKADLVRIGELPPDVPNFLPAVLLINAIAAAAGETGPIQVHVFHDDWCATLRPQGGVCNCNCEVVRLTGALEDAVTSGGLVTAGFEDAVAADGTRCLTKGPVTARETSGAWLVYFNNVYCHPQPKTMAEVKRLVDRSPGSEGGR